MIRGLLFLLIVIIMVNGCSTLDSKKIGEEMGNISFSDGITKEEAIIIAKQHCLNNSACHKNCNINSPIVSEDEKWFPGQWIVSFRTKRLAILDHTYLVFIDKKTGEVTRAELTK